MVWPWRRFDKLYERFKIRQTIEEIKRRRDQSVAAYQANSAFNESTEAGQVRQEIIDQIEKSAKELIHALVTGRKLPEQEAADDAWENDPLFRPLRRQKWEMQQAAERGRAQAKAQMPNAGRAGDMIVAGAMV